LLDNECKFDSDATIQPIYYCRQEKEYHCGRSMIRKLKSGKYRIYSRRVDPKTGKRRNLGTFGSRAAAEKHEREIQYFKQH
jgi:hypothetical protein